MLLSLFIVCCCWFYFLILCIFLLTPCIWFTKRLSLLFCCVVFCFLSADCISNGMPRFECSHFGLIECHRCQTLHFICCALGRCVCVCMLRALSLYYVSVMNSTCPEYTSSRVNDILQLIRIRSTFLNSVLNLCVRFFFDDFFYQILWDIRISSAHSPTLPMSDGMVHLILSRTTKFL